MPLRMDHFSLLRGINDAPCGFLEACLPIESAMLYVFVAVQHRPDHGPCMTKPLSMPEVI